MKLLKKNQVIIYVIALMLVTAGYLNYTSNENSNLSLETSMQMDSKDDSKLADIGDATLVNSSDVIENNTEKQNELTDESSTNNINSTNTKESTVEQNISEEKEDANSQTIETNSQNSNDYFTKSKLERETMYSQMLETYEKVLNSSNSMETQKQTATQEITKINELKNSIMICENLIKTKGFENNIVFANGDSINVIIGAKELNQEEVAQIQNIISREMNSKIENIHISNK